MYLVKEFISIFILNLVEIILKENKNCFHFIHIHFSNPYKEIR